MKNFIALLMISGLLISCSGNNQLKVESDATLLDQPADPELFAVSRYEVHLLTDPEPKVARIVNQKAAETLRETYYILVGRSLKITILSEYNEWVNVKVIEPNWLQNTHIGWMAIVGQF
ncbi:hypothetical protein DSL64_03035 [Dyadobacter luteus]|uniref:Uncharacterized protein n=1 Tax=Dyadobacter luteus TaxID=2259619 RepID=A0A3D8YFF4_9BACT|nr:hypothetical protein [Dyadobacter luteus]REA63438.1 hypothetical protein DSL64_03035 [Dyadobacter luteus]